MHYKTTEHNMKLIRKHNDIRAMTVFVTTASPCRSVVTGGSARDVTHFITSITQSFVYKCNIVTVANCFI